MQKWISSSLASDDRKKDRYGLVAAVFCIAFAVFLWLEPALFALVQSSLFRQNIPGTCFLLQETDNIRDVFFMILNLILASQFIIFTVLCLFIREYRKISVGIMIFIFFILWLICFVFRLQYWVSFDDLSIRRHSLMQESIHSYSEISGFQTSRRYRGGVSLKVQFHDSSLTLHEFFLKENIPEAVRLIQKKR